MPLLTATVPRYRKHRASGQAVVTLSGQDFYLGPHGTRASHLEYDRRIAEWLAHGRALVPTNTESASPQLLKLLVAYKRHAESYYVKEGRPTNEVKMIFAALKVLRQLYGREPIADFGPLKLQAVQQAMIRTDWSRGLINKQIGRIKRMFHWGVAQELVPPQVLHAIQEVPGLAKGRTAAREIPPIVPVLDDIVAATIARLPPIVADMVRLQKLTGARPEEICLLRLADIERSGSIWEYRPQRHKTQHQGRERIIHLGPQSQSILARYLDRDPSGYVFSPAIGEQTRRLIRHRQRMTPLTAGNRPGSNRQRRPRRSPGDHYTTSSYRRAIHRACQLAGVEKWGPHRLRHSAATAIQRQFGLEAAQATLGHQTASVTQIYAQRNEELAARVAREVG